MAGLDEKHFQALDDALSVAARLGNSYEAYGGVNLDSTLKYGNEAVERLRERDVLPEDEPVPIDLGNLHIAPEVKVAADKVDLGNMPAPDARPRRMCRSCESSLGHEHSEMCEYEGAVLSFQVQDEPLSAEAIQALPQDGIGSETSGAGFAFRPQEQMGAEPPMNTDDPLTTFLYLLLRDKINAGAIEHIVCEIEREAEQTHSLTNRFVGAYAKNVAERITAAAGRRLAAMEKER